MIIEKPSVSVEYFEPLKLMRNIEKACRTCYRSEDKITENSYQSLLKNCINRGHESVLEHEKITVRLRCDIGVYKDLTRHRISSFSIESTRYCNYGKDKFDNQIHFIEPVFYDGTWTIANYEGSAMNHSQQKSRLWYNCMEDIEETYLDMSKLGSTPDEMRMILPHSTAATVTMTANLREWKHILELRCTNHAHPAVQQVMIPLLIYFQETMFQVFGNIEYNKDFPKDKYAKLILEEV